ncbi:MAG: SpoIIE family protein phosphatase [Clostridium sp.]
MGITVDVTYKSLNKYEEILCGDTVEILRTEDSDVCILADGMGSGVKANILSTLTAKILGTMFLNGATLEECVETIVQTLPICQIRQVAYATFSILQVFNNGDAYLVEYDNPRCIFIRDGKVVKIPKNSKIIKDKEINEFRFKVQKGDALILMSDGTIHAGVGRNKSFGWPWEEIADFAAEQYKNTISSMRLATLICEACDELYGSRPGDDTTVAVMRMIGCRPVHLMTGPPVNRDYDETIVEDFMKDETAGHIVAGGTSATILSRELGRELTVSMDYTDPDIPPMAYIEGIDLVTEGVLTMSRVASLLKQFTDQNGLNPEFFEELDKKNGASILAKILIEDCTELHMYVGKAVNSAYQNPGLPFDLGIRQNLVEQLKNTVEKMGKRVTVTYY